MTSSIEAEYKHLLNDDTHMSPFSPPDGDRYESMGLDSSRTPASAAARSLDMASTAVHVLLNKNSEFCFDLGAFNQPDFDAREFVRSVNEELKDFSSNNQSSLEILRNDLKRYGEKLKSQLIDLLNRDYADFISLSSNLMG